MTQIKEEAIHCHIAQYLSIVIDEPSRWCTVEVSNQQKGKAGMLKQKALKRKGVITGWPDIQIFWIKTETADWREKLELIFLEVKSATGSLSKEQKALHIELRNEGHYVFVVRSVDDVKKALQEVGMI